MTKKSKANPPNMKTSEARVKDVQFIYKSVINNATALSSMNISANPSITREAFLRVLEKVSNQDQSQHD